MHNDALIKYLTNGGLSKTLGIIIIFIFTVGCGFIAMYEILSGQTINNIVAAFLGIVLTHVTNMLFQTQASNIVTSALLANTNMPPVGPGASSPEA